MDFSKYAIKYKPLDLGKWEVPDVEPINIDRLNYSIAEPPKLELLVIPEGPEYEEPDLTLRPIVLSTVLSTVKTPNFSLYKGLGAFNKNYDLAILQGGPEAEQLKSRRALLTHLAKAESGFRSDPKNNLGAPAYGYFAFMQGNYKGKNYNNVRTYAGVDLNTFRSNPVLQIRAANNLANYFMKNFSKLELDLMHKKGWTDNAIIAGAWLGGPGGVRAYVFRNQDRSDGYMSVGKRMREFNY